jgi:hypothetical protein
VPWQLRAHGEDGRAVAGTEGAAPIDIAKAVWAVKPPDRTVGRVLRIDGSTAVLELARVAKTAAPRKSAMHGESGFDRLPHDAYFTIDEMVTQGLAENVTFRGNLIWECACGAGHMARVLERYGYTVLSTDLVDHGYGKSGIDFLTAPPADAASIVTNPPYGDLAEPFIRRALEHTRPVGGQVAMLLRAEYDSAGERSDLFKSPHFYMRLALTKRPHWVTDKGSPRHNYAWFVWDWAHLDGGITRYWP